jgi:hypothetical protein
MPYSTRYRAGAAARIDPATPIRTPNRNVARALALSLATGVRVDTVGIQPTRWIAHRRASHLAAPISTLVVPCIALTRGDIVDQLTGCVGATDRAAHRRASRHALPIGAHRPCIALARRHVVDELTGLPRATSRTTRRRTRLLAVPIRALRPPSLTLAVPVIAHLPTGTFLVALAAVIVV